MARNPAPRRRAGGAKPKRDYAAEYARRVAGTAKGSAERQAKRGHRPPPGKTEYRARAEREAREDTTTSQRATIRKWVREQARRNKASASDTAAMETHMIGKIAQGGSAAYERFKAMTAELRRMHRTRAHQGKVLVLAGRAANRAIMQDFADQWDIDLEWLLYG